MDVVYCTAGIMVIKPTIISHIVMRSSRNISVEAFALFYGQCDYKGYDAGGNADDSGNYGKFVSVMLIVF